jgi:putative tryptophan/tyrosine transport system substrate-binding protein
VRRREFITLLGGAVVAWPIAARAQHSATPEIGLLRTVSLAGFDRILPAFRQGLLEVGYVDGQNVKIEHRWADGKYDRLPALADELVRRQPAVIVAIADPAAIAAKAATSIIPIVFNTGTDPVQLGLVSNLSRPDGNLTGLSQLNNALASKRLELLRELVPTASAIACLANPTNPNMPAMVADIRSAARSLDRQVDVFSASDEREIEIAFAAIGRAQIRALLIASDPVLLDQRYQLAQLAARYAVPTLYTVRDYAVAGGLISYAADQSDLYRRTGIYAARILKGAKPADLPVMQPTKFELVINLKTAKALDLDVPPSLLARADEVIE